MGGTQVGNVCRGWGSRVCSPAPSRTAGVTPRDLLGPSGPQLAQTMGANYTTDPHRIALRFRENKLRALGTLPDRWSAFSEAGSWCSGWEASALTASPSLALALESQESQGTQGRLFQQSLCASSYQQQWLDEHGVGAEWSVRGGRPGAPEAECGGAATPMSVVSTG